ncbi:unnamed protein product [Cyclocybe aegerita]|uniref:Coenzyme Q-binding protein COQ10 START domain-containing protein n=1 Tax=Cyclocybe aegerita TaxID=1973307 RepID=A0A8S0VSZ0_CYCAE|nr:unnamed protein product [Cyclocybe aegerita]
MLWSTSLIAFLGAYCAGAQTPPSNLPPATTGIFTVQASVIINAPIEKVWNTLLDFPSYAQWNPFVRSQVVTSAIWVPLEDQTPHENQRLIIQAQIPPLPMPVDANTHANPLHMQTSFENITTLDRVQHRAAWRQIFLPKPVLDAERWQALSALPGKRTYYESREVFDGPVGHVVDALFAEGLQAGFDAQAAALKARVEQ